MFNIQGKYPPALFIDIFGNKWAMAGDELVQVPLDTVRADLNWIRPKLPEVSGVKIVKTFSSSRDPKIKYKVYDNGAIKYCDCPGYTYRRKCRHMTEVNNES